MGRRTLLDIASQDIVIKTGRQRVADALLGSFQPEPVHATYVWREYINKDTGKRYDYHHHCTREHPGNPPCFGTDETCTNANHMAEKLFVYQDYPKYCLVKGGEGGGKSVCGIIKTLERLRRGMYGILVSPDFEHFKKSLWAEFRRWCPTEAIIPRERYRLRPDWEPSKQFELHFINELPGSQTTTLYLGGMDDPTGWEGPNVCFAHGDEVRRKQDAEILKVLAGRVRINGVKGEKPQLWFTTTPKKHWLFDWFGGVPDPMGRLDEGAEHYKEDDKHASFKKKAIVISLFTRDNQANLTDDYVEDRASAIDSEAERRVLLEAAWEDVADISHYLDSPQLFTACEDHTLPPLGANEPVVMAVDGAYAAKGDVFAIVMAGIHPFKPDVTAIRHCQGYEASKDTKRNFDDIEDDIKCLCLDHAVTEVFYDPRELHHMMTRVRNASKTRDGRRFPGVMTTEFPQGADREKADKVQLDKIRSRLFAHDGHPMLKEHFNNADKKTTDDGKHCRIVKRHESQKIDLCVAASMAGYKADTAIPMPPPPVSESSGPFRNVGRSGG